MPRTPSGWKIDGVRHCVGRLGQGLLCLVVAVLGIVGGEVLLAAPADAQAPLTTLYVAQGGSDSSNTCTSSASPCATISNAVNQAVSGDTIEVAGTIADHVDVGTSLTISQWAGQAAAVVDGSNSGTPFTIESGATVSLEQLTVENGEGYAGGGIHNEGTLTVTDSTITHNTADLVGGGGGGGILNRSTLTVTDSTISYNTANSGSDGGGGIYNNGGTLTVTDSTISNNTAPDGGGGINNIGGGTPTITASTISNNSAASGNGGGIENSGGTWTVGATIVAANTGGNCHVNGMVSTAGYNLTDDSSGSTCGFTGTTDVIGANPHLGSLADNGGPTQTLLPAATSPAVGVIPLGTTLNGLAVCPGIDQRGVARPQPAGGSACTVGAVEVAPLTTLYVAQGGSDSSNTCTSSASPCATISNAVNQAVSGDTIEVAGTIADHVDVGTSLTISQWAGQAAAVVDGSNSGTPFTIESGATVSLEQLTVENGEGYAGGGIHNEGTLTVTDSTITHNTADLVGGGGGGGILNRSTLTVTDSTISYNTANSGSDGGGGIYNNGGTLTVTDSTISNNTAPDGGGGINNIGGGTPTITASTISNNSAASGNGGGIENSGGTWTVGATIVAANTGGNCHVNGMVSTAGYNLTDDSSGSTCGFTGTTDVIGANPHLGSLADNGGPTQTLLPAATSPAAFMIPANTTVNGVRSARVPTRLVPRLRSQVRAAARSGR